MLKAPAIFVGAFYVAIVLKGKIPAYESGDAGSIPVGHIEYRAQKFKTK